MDRFLHERMDAVLGKRLGDIVAEITHRRQEYLEAAIDTLRVQYPGYAEALERRMLRRIGVRFEEREYTRLHEESLIGEELYDQIMRELAERRDQMSQRLRFNLQSGLDRRVRALPVFAGLEEATLHDLSMRMTMRFAAPGERLVRARRRVHSVFFVGAGTVEIKAGDETFRLRDGDFFGVDDVLNARRSTIAARAINFTNLLELRRRDFERILADNPTLGERIAQAVAQQRADRDAAARAEADAEAESARQKAGTEAEAPADGFAPYPLPRPHVVH
jgi:CPA1 family monovalent cation:H+ antiporter